MTTGRCRSRRRTLLMTKVARWKLEERQMADYGLVLAFDTDDPQFTRGFNAGALYGWLSARKPMLLGQNAEPPFDVRADNLEMVLRIADSLGLDVATQDDGSDHLGVRFSVRTPT